MLGWTVFAAVMLQSSFGLWAPWVFGEPEADAPQKLQHPSLEGRPLELTSSPGGAYVYVDDQLLPDRTPVTLYFSRDSSHRLGLRKTGLRVWAGVIKNSKALHIDLMGGQHEETRYDEEPAAVLEAPVVQANEKREPDDGERLARQLEKEAVFDIESPPVTTVLTHRHGVSIDEIPMRVLDDGATVALVRGLTVFPPDSSSSMMRSQQNKVKVGYGSATRQLLSQQIRMLNIFGIRSVGPRVEVFDLTRPIKISRGGTFRLFTATEVGMDQLYGGALLRIDGQEVTLEKGNQLQVQGDDSFLVRVLDPKKSYRFEVGPTSGDTRPVWPVLASFRPDVNDPQPVLRFDGQPLERGQLLVSAGVHTFSGALSLWLTLPTVERLVPSEVKVSIRQKR